MLGLATIPKEQFVAVNEKRATPANNLSEGIEIVVLSETSR
jgi:hypothetical protein